MTVPFNKPYVSGNEITLIQKALDSRKLSGGGSFTKQVHAFIENKYAIRRCLLTTSCTSALEMAALLLNLKEGDEIIIPSFAYVTTANAFALHGVKIIFCDCKKNLPIIDEDKIEELITERTRAVVIMHYGGIACNMEAILSITKKHQLLLIEDAAASFHSFYTFKDGSEKALGSMGNLGTYSFHETKNISCGEGGLLCINDERFTDRAHTIWNKGTNRKEFKEGLVDKYEWVDRGSSFHPSEVTAATLLAQLQELEQIQEKRFTAWNFYEKLFQKTAIKTVKIPCYAKHNAHVFYILCPSLKNRNQLIHALRKKDVTATFHYQSLHKSPYSIKNNLFRKELKNADYFSNHLLRLPLFTEITRAEQEFVFSSIIHFFERHSSHLTV